MNIKAQFSLHKVQRKTWLFISVLIVLMVSLTVCVIALSTIHVETEIEIKTATNNAIAYLPTVIVLDQDITSPNHSLFPPINTSH
jgi:hypothetical protein